MKKRALLIILALTFIFPPMVDAGKKMSKKEKAVYDAKKSAYTEEYKAAESQGEESLDEFLSKTSHKGDAQENEWMNDLQYGETDKKGGRQKNKDGKAKNNKPKGFMGDQNDPGPQDWSDWNIKTDGKGNVIGFEEKDFNEKDADGDGEISKEEREEWDKKKEEENKERGGAPGEVPPVADWDEDGDGVPDDGYERWCWQCVPGDAALNECHYSKPGNCNNGGSCAISEVCHPANEVHHDVDYECHTCEYKTDQVDWCREKGYSSDPTCGGCPNGPCIPITVDIQSGSIVPDNQTRERGSTRQCYTCMNVSSVEVSYIIVIIETPYARYVLDEGSGFEGFSASQVMALARVDSAGGALSSLSGMLGGGVLGMLTSAATDLKSLSGLLSQSLGKGNKYSDNCFSKDFSAQELPQTPPAGTKPRKKKKKRKIRKMFPSRPLENLEQIR